MAIALKSVDDLQEHLLGVFERSDHHAGEVNEVLLAIAGGILWRKNPGDHVRVNEKEGAGGNVIWFRIGDQRYALLYNHRSRRIELMFGGRRGYLLHTFTNATPLEEVARVFATLGMSDEEAAAYRAERAEVKAKFAKGTKMRDKLAVKPVGEPAPGMMPIALAAGAVPDTPSAEAMLPKVSVTPIEPADLRKTTRARKAPVSAEAEGAPPLDAPKPARKARKTAAPQGDDLFDVKVEVKAAKPAARKAAKKTVEPAADTGRVAEAIQLPLTMPEPVTSASAKTTRRRSSKVVAAEGPTADAAPAPAAKVAAKTAKAGTKKVNGAALLPA